VVLKDLGIERRVQPVNKVIVGQKAAVPVIALDEVTDETVKDAAGVVGSAVPAISAIAAGGGKRKKTRKKVDRRIDLYLHKDGHAFYGDVRISEFAYHHWQNGATSKSSLEGGVKAKYDLYTNEYKLDKRDVVPLVFNTYGGYADCTMEFLRQVAKSAGNQDDILVSKIMRNLRDRIAVALHRGQVDMIEWLNRNNPYVESEAMKSV
jgi:hypothetical protein